MKKAEIKRRKRVVPANLQQSEQDGLQSGDPMDEDSQSETHSSVPPSASREYADSPAPRGGPIPVDFTDTFRLLRTADKEQSIPRKRSFSITNDGPEHPYPHAQNTRDTNHHIDPSLPNRTSPTDTDAKEARRAELQREADRFRRMLLEKERELAELG